MIAGRIKHRGSDAERVEKLEAALVDIGETLRQRSPGCPWAAELLHRMGSWNL